MSMRIILVLAALVLNQSCTTATFVVAPDGDDTGPGTDSRPFASLARAQDAVRVHRLRGRRPITVTIRAGTYYLEEPLRLTVEDSGAAGVPVVYQAEQEGAVVDYNLFLNEADRLAHRADGADAHSVSGDPMFMDPARGDYRVADDSPALAIGFKNVNGRSLQAVADLLAATNEAAGRPLRIGFVRHQAEREGEMRNYAWVLAESAEAEFHELPLWSADRVVPFQAISSTPDSANEPLRVLGDGALAGHYGPVFPNGAPSGRYRVDFTKKDWHGTELYVNMPRFIPRKEEQL